MMRFPASPPAEPAGSRSLWTSNSPVAAWRTRWRSTTRTGSPSGSRATDQAAVADQSNEPSLAPTSSASMATERSGYRQSNGAAAARSAPAESSCTLAARSS